MIVKLSIEARSFRAARIEREDTQAVFPLRKPDALFFYVIFDWGMLIYIIIYMYSIFDWLKSTEEPNGNAKKLHFFPVILSTYP